MKTRKKLQAEKEEVVKKSVVLKLRVHKFINPTTLYPVFNVNLSGNRLSLYLKPSFTRTPAEFSLTTVFSSSTG